MLIAQISGLVVAISGLATAIGALRHSQNTRAQVQANGQAPPSTRPAATPNR